MIRAYLTFTMTFVLLSPAAYADDDVDVTPSRNIARLEASDQQRPRADQDSGTDSDARPKPLKIAECDQAPGAQAAGLSCRVTAFPGTWSPLPADMRPADIERAIREVPMPPLKVRIQPGGRTLVNVDTIFYTDPTHLRRTVALLGHSVELDARPVRFTWVHGDGTRATTTHPGRPYPAKDVTHRYKQPGEGLRARVDTSYAVRYNIDGGGWADLGETLTAPGPSTTLDVDEAAPVLTR